MHQYTLTALVFGVVVLLLNFSPSASLVIDCQSNGLTEASPNVRRLCDTLSVIVESAAEGSKCIPLLFDSIS